MGVLQEKKAKAPTAKAAIPTDLSGVDLRVGVITTARKHENAESLYVESIECGEEKERQVGLSSGICRLKMGVGYIKGTTAHFLQTG